MKKFTQKANYPISYGDNTDDKIMVSDRVVELTKNQRFRNHMSAVGVACLAIATTAKPSAAIPPEYGEAVNEALNQAGQAAAAAGAAPPVGPVEGIKNLPVNNPVPQVPPIVPVRPVNPPAFYLPPLPPKPLLPVSRGANTALFGGAIGVICLNAFWGEPIAILMCATGLTGIALQIGREVVLFMAKNIAG